MSMCFLSLMKRVIKGGNMLVIRNVLSEDLEKVTEIEHICFPKEEAATKSALAYRIHTFPKSFFVALVDDRIVGHINGCCSNLAAICDELFEADGGHQPEGVNQMIFGLAVAPSFQKRGIAEALMNALLNAAKEAKRKQVILTCKAELLHYYEKFGFVNQGVSESTHGGALWYDMVYLLSDKK